MKVKEQLLNLINKNEIKCALVDFTRALEGQSNIDTNAILPVNYTEDQLNDFLSLIDIDYCFFEDSEFDGIEGTVWLKNGAWLRIEDDFDSCSTHWNYFEPMPNIPDELLSVN